MGLLDERGSYNYLRLRELNKFNNIKLSTKDYKEIWSDFCDVYVKSTERAQMVSYHFVGHSVNYKDYVAFLKANIGDEFIPLNKFSSKVSYKTAYGNEISGSTPKIFALFNDADAVKSGYVVGNRNKEFKLTIYVDGVPTNDFSFSQSNLKYGTIIKRGSTLILHSKTPNKTGCEIKIKTNDSRYTIILKWIK